MDRGTWQATWGCKESDMTERLSFTNSLTVSTLQMQSNLTLMSLFIHSFIHSKIIYRAADTEFL